MLVPSRSYTARKGGNFEINQDVVRPTMKSEQSEQRKNNAKPLVQNMMYQRFMQTQLPLPLLHCFLE